MVSNTISLSLSLSLSVHGGPGERGEDASHPGLAWRCLQDAIADLASDVADGTSAVWEEDGLCLRGGSNVAERLEVLGDEQQFRNLLCGEPLIAAMRDRITQSIDDRPALPCNALSLKLCRICCRLSALHRLDLLRFGGHNRGVAEALLLVDLVHGLLHRCVRRELRDQGLVDLEAVARHLL